MQTTWENIYFLPPVLCCRSSGIYRIETAFESGKFLQKFEPLLGITGEIFNSWVHTCFQQFFDLKLHLDSTSFSSIYAASSYMAPHLSPTVTRIWQTQIPPQCSYCPFSSYKYIFSRTIKSRWRGRGKSQENATPLRPSPMLINGCRSVVQAKMSVLALL